MRRREKISQCTWDQEAEKRWWEMKLESRTGWSGELYHVAPCRTLIFIQRTMTRSGGGEGVTKSVDQEWKWTDELGVCPGFGWYKKMVSVETKPLQMPLLLLSLQAWHPYYLISLFSA